jgi:hypothetical protein
MSKAYKIKKAGMIRKAAILKHLTLLTYSMSSLLGGASIESGLTVDNLVAKGGPVG